MFALALWDRRSRRLILARDRIGKKPLYYAPTGSPTAALSVRLGDQGAARLAGDARARPNLAAIDHYLTLQYVPAPDTAFAGINRLPPAHYLVVGADADGRWHAPEPVRYWELPEPQRGRAPRQRRRAAARTGRASRGGGAAAA